MPIEIEREEQCEQHQDSENSIRRETRRGRMFTAKGRERTVKRMAKSSCPFV
jgi:hypothetical protein